MGWKLEAIWLKPRIVELMGNAAQYNGHFLFFWKSLSLEAENHLDLWPNFIIAAILNFYYYPAFVCFQFL